MNKKNKLDFLESWNHRILKSLRKRFDSDNIFKSISDFKCQIEASFDIESKWSKNNKNTINKIISNDINSILVCGMGGSAIGAELANSMLFDSIKIPFTINRSTDIPNWVNNKTLVIILSYSGNTYETIQAFHESISKTKNIIAISSKFGKINKICLEKDLSIINIPEDLQPRCALGYISAILILVLLRLKLLIKPKKIKLDLRESIYELNHIDEMNRNVDNPMLHLSHKIKSLTPIIYGVENHTSIAALRFNNQLQENAKTISFHNNFPEIKHNEIESWHDNNNLFFIIWLDYDFLDKKLVLLMDKAFSLLDNLDIQQERILLNNKIAAKNNKIANLYKLIYFLDWVSYYTALLNGVKPISIKNIDFIKKFS